MPQPLSSGEIINWVRSRAAPAVLDGGLASMLEAAGVDTAGSLWSFRAMLEAPGEIEAATRAFLCAGADIVSTATYQASHETLVASSISADDAASLMLRAVALTVHVRDEFVAARTTPCAPRRQPLVALSLGPWGAAQSGGLEYTGEYPTDYHTCERIEQFHACRAKALFSVKLDHDLPDIVAFETIPITLEAKIVATMMVSGAHSLHPMPFWVSFQCRDNDHIASGERLSVAVEAVLNAAAHSPQLIAIGVNCVSPRFLSSLVAIVRRKIEMHQRAGTLEQEPRRTIQVVAYPNSGEEWAHQDAQWVWPSLDKQPPVKEAEWARVVLACGADVVGGCCRTLSPHIAALATARDMKTPAVGSTCFL
jgi:homocysteine S-methyltransferase